MVYQVEFGIGTTKNFKNDVFGLAKGFVQFDVEDVMSLLVVVKDISHGDVSCGVYVQNLLKGHT